MTETREQILTALRERILTYATSRIGKDPAEDLVQEALVVIEQKYGHLDRLEDLLPLSFQILRFKMNDFRRKSVRRGEFTAVDVTELPLADERPGAEVLLETKELESRLAKALAALDGRCREMFRLKLEGRSFVEIAKIMGVASVNTVYTWDFRCRKTLLEKMGGTWSGGKP